MSARSTRPRLLAGASILAAMALTLAACSDSGENGSTTPAPSAPVETTAAPETSAAPEATGEAGADGGSDGDLQAAVDALLAPRDSYPVPSADAGDVSSLAGTTVYYIPLTQQAPQFAVTGAAVEEAFAAADMNVQICNGNATPTEITTCINQATAANAGAIITDAIPYGMAANALDAAQAAGIPVIQNNNYEMPDHPASDTLYYAPDGAKDQLVGMIQWIALDSDGAGTVVFNEATDGSSALYAADAIAEAEADCPDCTIVINEVSSSNFGLIGSSTSSALLQNPDTGYVLTQFAIHLQPAQGGVEQAGRIDDVKGLVGASQLGALQQVAAENFVYVAGGQASVFQGWVSADIAMRAMLGTDVPEYDIPVRLFTRDTIADVTLTAEAEASGEWFGPATFRDDFLAIWGLQ